MPDARRELRGDCRTTTVPGRHLVTFTALVLAGCAGATAAPTPGVASLPALSRRDFTRLVDSMVLAPAFQNAHWGVMIVDPGSGDTIYSHNAGKLFMPASNQKLLTGATALAQLGADYRFVTRFAATGPVQNGVLDGDLVIIPSGDPTFADTNWRGDHRNAFRAMADSLRARGITHIRGSMVRGGTPFPDQSCGFGWELDDLNEPYGACVQDLFVNEGLMRVPRLRTPTDSAMTAVAIRNPRGAFFAALRTAMGERSISMGGGIDTSRVAASTGLTPLFEMQSPALPVVLTRMMKPSQNQVAEILFKTLGRERTGVGSADSGRRVVERQLRAWGADSVEFAVRDGSGMSRHDYVSPRTLVKVLDTMMRAPTFGIWLPSLPIGGVDGTLASRMRGTPAAGNVHAKTGTVDKARSLSGYVTTADGRRLIFSFLCNNFTTPTREVERVQDAILVALASRPRPR
jgi:D-alanyl-D-alanine carboxypeptidase/D-alanyl-D-alanine-endopeptidase (penicillin-binding protein 4)